jgi:hypothetical protein
LLIIQFKLNQGFKEGVWIMSYYYLGFLLYRAFGYIENYLPQSIKPFPYVNLWSSSNIVLWINIGREFGY